jgi:Protein of unknown function (DUF778)
VQKACCEKQPHNQTAHNYVLQSFPYSKNVALDTILICKAARAVTCHLVLFKDMANALLRTCNSSRFQVAVVFRYWKCLRRLGYDSCLEKTSKSTTVMIDTMEAQEESQSLSRSPSPGLVHHRSGANLVVNDRPSYIAEPPGYGVNDNPNDLSFCIVWSPLPPITWIIPFIGHTGIADSRGALHERSSD